MNNRQRGGVMTADPTLTPEFWLALCGEANPSSRDKFLYLTIDEFSRLGPGAFSHASIARRLGVTVAMINHYFGSRNGLISEGAYTVYSAYIDALGAAVRDAPREPVARLRAWITTQISYCVSVAGWQSVLNYPTLTLENPLEFAATFRERISEKFNINMARLGQLILDVKSGEVYPQEIDESNVDVARYMSDLKLVSLSTCVGMATMGAAVWAAGSHSPSAESPEAKQIGDFALAEHVNHLIRLVQLTDISG
jgi:AcrR family transcriptional regulator